MASYIYDCIERSCTGTTNTAALLPTVLVLDPLAQAQATDMQVDTHTDHRVPDPTTQQQIPTD